MNIGTAKICEQWDSEWMFTSVFGSAGKRQTNPQDKIQEIIPSQISLEEESFHTYVTYY